MVRGDASRTVNWERDCDTAFLFSACQSRDAAGALAAPEEGKSLPARQTAVGVDYDKSARTSSAGNTEERGKTVRKELLTLTVPDDKGRGYGVVAKGSGLRRISRRDSTQMCTRGSMLRCGAIMARKRQPLIGRKANGAARKRRKWPNR